MVCYGSIRTIQFNSLIQKQPQSPGNRIARQSTSPIFYLKAAVEREKAVQREWKNCVVTFWVMRQVMSQLFHFLGASRRCADFRDPTAVFRFKGLCEIEN
jgi:hypothetical protein